MLQTVLNYQHVNKIKKFIFYYLPNFGMKYLPSTGLVISMSLFDVFQYRRIRLLFMLVTDILGSYKELKETIV